MACLMVQGTGSDVGKSILVAGLCRLFANRGLRVRPFKPQNMSNNAAVTADGGEIGRAQALQALACRVAPTVDMNPVLLKPQSDTGAQLIIHGRVVGEWRSGAFADPRPHLLDAALASFARLRDGADLVIGEGAGSPAETNLRTGDIANMGFARVADVPVILAGDIDRGGVIASLVGTHEVLDAGDRAMIRGFLINKFRGDPTLFDSGYREIERRTGWRGVGVVPWLPAARRLPAEDAVALDEIRPAGAGSVTVAVPMLSRISNFDDFDPLKLEPSVRLVMVPPGRAIPGDAALVILPGSKATIADLSFFRAQGWDIDLKAHHRRGGMILGICGGYQMLGRSIADPAGLEGPPSMVEGLGYLDVETVLTGEKSLVQVSGQDCRWRAPLSGYEMHVGRTTGPGVAHPLLRLTGGRDEGAISADGRVAGCYVHGLFAQNAQRAAWLAQLGAVSAGIDYHADVDAGLDELAAALAVHLDVTAIGRIAGLAA